MRVIRIFTAVTVAIAVATAIGMALLWPSPVTTAIGESVAAGSQSASVERVTEYRCEGVNNQACRRVGIRIVSGPDSGDTSELVLGVAGLDPDERIDFTVAARDVTLHGECPACRAAA